MPKLPHSWLNALGNDIFQTEKSCALREKIHADIQAGNTLYPHPKNFFHAYNCTDFEDVKVVILGQDPYHGPGQAHGLSFSVREGVPHPPSLRNIFKEIESDVGTPVPVSGDLTRWSQQGVFLLNATLCVLQGQPMSYAGYGWEEITDATIRALSEKREGIIFLLWGAHAQKKSALIDETRHHILKAPHPSPLSAHRGFFGCQHFSKCNKILRSMGQQEIVW